MLNVKLKLVVLKPNSRSYYRSCRHVSGGLVHRQSSAHGADRPDRQHHGVAGFTRRSSVRAAEVERGPESARALNRVVGGDPVCNAIGKTTWLRRGWQTDMD